MASWVSVELDTTPPSGVAGPASVAVAGPAAYTGEMTFSESVQVSSIYMEDAQGQQRQADGFSVSGNKVTFLINLQGIAPGDGFIAADVADDVGNSATVKFGVYIVAVAEIGRLMVLPKREFDLVLDDRSAKLLLSERHFEFR